MKEKYPKFHSESTLIVNFYEEFKKNILSVGWQAPDTWPKYYPAIIKRTLMDYYIDFIPFYEISYDGGKTFEPLK